MSEEGGSNRLVGPPVVLFEGPALPPPEEVRRLVEEGAQKVLGL